MPALMKAAVPQGCVSWCRPAAGLPMLLVLLIACCTAHTAALEQPRQPWQLLSDSLEADTTHCIPPERAIQWAPHSTNGTSAGSIDSSSMRHAMHGVEDGMQRQLDAAQKMQTARFRRRQLRVAARRLAAAAMADAAAVERSAMLMAGQEGVRTHTEAASAAAGAAAGDGNTDTGAVRRMQLLARSDHDGSGEHTTAHGPSDGTSGPNAAPGSGMGSASGGSSSGSSGKAPARQAVDGFQIALVNDVTFHHEVTLGFMAALQHHKANLKVYVRRELLGFDHSSFGFGAYVTSRLPGNTLRDAYYKEGIAPADVAIFLSPEFSVDYVKEFIARSRPRMVIMCIHEPRMQLRRLTYLLGLHKLVGIITLSPHVANVLSQRLRGAHVHWMLPTLSARCDNSCYDGFAVQGKFESSRRNYHELWSALEALSTQQQQEQLQQQLQQQALEQQSTGIDASSSQMEAAGASTPHIVVPRVNVMGTGRLVNLSLPATLRGHVHVYGNLSFADYYDTICRSVALLPLFNASSGYLYDKISSTVLTSLITGVPMVVPPTFLEVYSQFKEQHVLVQHAHTGTAMSSDGHVTSGDSSDPASGSMAGRRPTSGPSHRKRRHGRGKAAALHAGDALDELKGMSLQAPSMLQQRGLLQQQQQQQQQQHQQEEEADNVVGGMLQVLALPDGVLANKRRALARLRHVLNHQAAVKLDGLMSAAVGQPHSGPKA